MLKLAELVLFGTITDTQARAWKSEKGQGVIHSVYMVGARVAYEVTLPDDMVGKVNHGDVVALVVRTSVYGDRVQYNALGFWSGDVGNVPAAKAS